MLDKIQDMEDHYIVVGFGRVGTLTAYELKQRNEEFVVLDTEISINHSYFSEKEILGLVADATEDEALIAAGIKKAKGLIVATGNPAVTVFVVLSGRQLNPNLNIVARADDDQVIPKLLKAGANRIVNPYAAGGFKLASIAVNPAIVDFFDAGTKNKGFNLEMIEVPIDSSFSGKTLKELDIRKRTGVTIVSIMNPDGSLTVTSGDYKMKESDKFLAAGTLKQLQELEKIIY